MALKSILDDIAELPEAIQAEYTKKKIGDKEVYVLDVEGVQLHPDVINLKTALDRQKNDNKTLKKEKGDLETKIKDLPEEFTIDEWHRLQALDVDPNDPDATKKKKDKEDERLAAARKGYETQIATLKKTIEDKEKEFNSSIAGKDAVIHNISADIELSAALSKAGVKPELMKAAKALHRSNIKVDDTEVNDGKPRTFVETDLGEQDVDTFIENWSKSDEGKAMIIPPSGGGANGRDKNTTSMEGNPFTKNAWNKTEQSKLYKNDRPKAERFAKSAGFSTLEVAIAAGSAISKAS